MKPLVQQYNNPEYYFSKKIIYFIFDGSCHTDTVLLKKFWKISEDRKYRSEIEIIDFKKDLCIMLSKTYLSCPIQNVINPCYCKFCSIVCLKWRIMWTLHNIGCFIFKTCTSGLLPVIIM